MKRSASSRPGRLWFRALLVAASLSGAAGLSAQTSPPPVQGTIALEGTMRKFYKGVNVIVVATMDGVEHTYHFAKDLVVHGGKGTGPDALQGLEEGTMVVLHYSGTGADAAVREIDRVGDNGLKVTEGRVTRVDHGRREITIRFGNGKTETLRLTERAAAESRDVDEAVGTRVVIYYSDESGNRVAHYFRAAP